MRYFMLISLVLYNLFDEYVNVLATSNNTTIANKKHEDESYERKKGKRCIKDRPYVWCIPSSYNKETEPWDHLHAFC